MTKGLTCERCQALYAPSWGGHVCLDLLPPAPKMFDEQKKGKGGAQIPKADYHDRKAWLESAAFLQAADLMWLDVDAVLVDGKTWSERAAAYRAEAEERVAAHLAQNAAKILESVVT